MKKQQDKEIWIFLSHSNEDYDKVRIVRNMLEEQDLRPIMFFLKCLNDDNEIDELIKREIDCRTRFILCDSENARKSKWVKEEVDYIQQSGRKLEVIDLSKDFEDIKKQLIEINRNKSLFLNYSHNDIEIAKRLKQRLDKYDVFMTWIDIENIEAGALFKDQIIKGINNCMNSGCMISLITNNYINSNWCMYELRYAVQMDNNRRNILPVYIDDSRIPFLNSYNSIIGEKYLSLDEIFDRILARILPFASLPVYANNFEKGIGVEQDKDEAKRLRNLINVLYDESKEIANRLYYDEHFDYPSYHGMRLGCAKNLFKSAFLGNHYSAVELKSLFNEYPELIKEFNKQDLQKIGINI